METFVTVRFALPKQAELRPPPHPSMPDNTVLSAWPHYCLTLMATNKALAEALHLAGHKQKLRWHLLGRFDLFRLLGK